MIGGEGRRHRAPGPGPVPPGHGALAPARRRGRVAPRRAPRPDPGPRRRAPARGRVRPPPAPRAAARPLGHQRHADGGPAPTGGACPGSTVEVEHRPPPSTTPAPLTLRATTPATATTFDLRLTPDALTQRWCGSAARRAVRFDRRWPGGRQADDHAARRAPALVLGARPVAALRARHRRRRAVLGDGRRRHGGARAGHRRRAHARLRGGVERSAVVAIGAIALVPGVGAADGRRGAAALLRADGPAPDAGALVQARHRPLPRRAAALVRRAPHRRAARPRRRRLRARDHGDAAPPLLARRGLLIGVSMALLATVDWRAPRRRQWRCSPGWRCSTTPTRSASRNRPRPPRPGSATCRASPTRASRGRSS